MISQEHAKRLFDTLHGLVNSPQLQSECWWCFLKDEHKPDCLLMAAVNLVREVEAIRDNELQATLLILAGQLTDLASQCGKGDDQDAALKKAVGQFMRSLVNKLDPPQKMAGDGAIQ